METILTQPSATPVIQALRSIGYSVNTAIADLVDNCIDANASNIEIMFDYLDGNGIIQIIDDGIGMDELGIQQAMNIGSKDPRNVRGSQELGRFGMGLKTASFSLGRRLSVLSKQGDRIVERCWDLDYVSETNEWYLFKKIPVDLQKYMSNFIGETGTIIIIDKLDRFMRAGTDQPILLKSFLEKAKRIQTHLSFVFHSFLESKKFNLKINGNEIEPWNPFLIDNDYTIKLRKQRLKQDNINVEVSSYVLPHVSHFNQLEYKEAGGIRGWRDQQGFYIYRENRLLYFGDWLGMFPKDSSSQLARIRIDLTNEADELWQVDVKKSTVTPPEGPIAVRLNAIAKQVRAQSKEIFYFRTQNSGMHPSIKGNVNPWVQSGQDEGPQFILNRSHPFLTEVLESINDDKARILNMYLKLVQLGSPANAIQVTKVEEGKIQPISDAETDMIIQLAELYNHMTMVTEIDQMTDIILMQPAMDKFNRETIVYLLEGHKDQWIKIS
jgi:hypothetical protein